jgi:arginine repressor
MGNYASIKNANEFEELKKIGKPMVVVFFCNQFPSQSEKLEINQIMINLDSNYSGINFRSVNTDDNKELDDLFDSIDPKRNFPLVVAYDSKGNVIQKMINPSKEKVERIISTIAGNTN